MFILEKQDILFTKNYEFTVCREELWRKLVLSRHHYSQMTQLRTIMNNDLHSHENKHIFRSLHNRVQPRVSMMIISSAVIQCYIQFQSSAETDMKNIVMSKTSQKRILSHSAQCHRFKRNVRSWRAALIQVCPCLAVGAKKPSPK